MGSSPLCLSRQTRLAATELAIKGKRGGTAGRSAQHVCSSFFFLDCSFFIIFFHHAKLPLASLWGSVCPGGMLGTQSLLEQGGGLRAGATAPQTPELIFLGGTAGIASGVDRNQLQSQISEAQFPWARRKGVSPLKTPAAKQALVSCMPGSDPC